MLSGNINIEDNDWDSVRQGYAALTRDLERISLSFGLGGNDFGGGVPKNANDQTVQQDGNYGYQAVTTDMLDDVEARLQAAIDAAIAGIPVVTYPISIANGGTGATTSSGALHNLQAIFDNNVKYSTAGSTTWTVPAGVERIYAYIVGGGGGGSSSGFSGSIAGPNYVYAGGTSGGTGGALHVWLDVYAGEILTINVGAGGTLGNSGGSSSIVTPVGSPYRIQMFGPGGPAGYTSFFTVATTASTVGYIDAITGTADANVLGRRCVFAGIQGQKHNVGQLTLSSVVSSANGGNVCNGVLLPGSFTTYGGSGGSGCDSSNSGGSAGTDGFIVIYY